MPFRSATQPALFSRRTTSSPGEASESATIPQMHLTAGNPLLPIASLVAGVFLIVAPQIVSFAVAVYLIFVGLLRLNGIYHIVH